MRNYTRNSAIRLKKGHLLCIVTKKSAFLRHQLTNQKCFSSDGTSIDHDPAIFFHWTNLDYVGQLVHANDGVLIVNAEKN